jgi:hypothetical protein
MSRSRSLLVGAALLLAAAIPLLLVAQQQGAQTTEAMLLVAQQQGAQTTDEPRVPGRGDYLSPHEVPFPSAESVSLGAASSAAPFPIHRPDHPLASDATLTDVWVQLRAADSDEPATQVALWYSSGLEIHMTRVSPGDKEPLVSDFPKDLPVSYEKIGDTEARVIVPGVLAPGQPGSVALVRDGVFITLFGWLPDLSAEDLRSIASTMVVP